MPKNTTTNQQNTLSAALASQSVLIRLPEVKEITALPTSTIYAMIQKDEFPKQVNLGARSVAWLKDEVLAWVKQKIDNSRPNQAAEPLPIAPLISIVPATAKGSY